MSNTRKNDPTVLLIKAAEHEMFQFTMNEKFYTVDALISLGLANKIPNLVKLNKKFKGTKILNVGGCPTLFIKTNGKII